MSVDNGGGPSGSSERIAPVIPLFGGAVRDADGSSESSAPPTESPGEQRSPGRITETIKADLVSEEWAGAGTPSERHPARGGRKSAPVPRLRAVESTDDGDIGPADPDPAEVRTRAEEGLVRKLRARSLSVSEARQVLRGQNLPADQVDDVLDDFLRRGYLDDTALAQSLVIAGAERKGQGRVALSRALAQRGIGRDIIASALDELPNDDEERALEFARTKARALGRLDPEVALRRLVGQLARRGYGGAVAMRAAKAALGASTLNGRSSGVHFVDSD